MGEVINYSMRFVRFTDVLDKLYEFLERDNSRGVEWGIIPWLVIAA
jgi:hypothetical protein